MNDTITDREVQLGHMIGELRALRAENARLRRLTAPKAVKPRKAKVRKITAKAVTGCNGSFASPGMTFGAYGLDAWKRAQRGAYLEATRKAEVPAPDPAFGRMAA